MGSKFSLLVFSRMLGLAFGAISLISLAGGSVEAAPLSSADTTAKQAIIIDEHSGMVLMEKNADQLMSPSSMTKLMTAYMVFDQLKDGNWSEDDELPVSEDAWKKHYRSGGSLMFLEVFSRAKISDLLRGVIIQSGNDACSVLAEAHSGSEESFAEEATLKAREMGMKNTTFRNASGMPNPEHLSTARDLSILAHRLIQDYPQYLPIYSEKEFTYNGIKQGNRNPLLYNVQGGDGLKTGYTNAGGYGLVGTVKRGNQRIIFVLNGMESLKERKRESIRLTEWAFREFATYPLYAINTPVAETDVWMGSSKTVKLNTNENINVFLSKKSRKDVKVKVVYDTPVIAPIAQGQVLGKLTFSIPGQDMIEYPLVAASAVGELSGFSRFIEVINGLKKDIF